MIPRIDVRACNAKKAYEGELSFEYEGDATLIDLPETVYASPVRAELRYEIHADNSVTVEGTLSFRLKGPCARCLSPVETEIDAEIDARFVEGEGDGETTYGYRGVVDLSELLRDTTLLALPARLVCETACELPVWDNENEER